MTYFIVNAIIIALAMVFGTSGYNLDRVGIKHNKNGAIVLRKDFILAVLASLVLTIFMGFRNSFTPDHDMYVNIFLTSCRQNLTAPIRGRVESGYIIINRVIGIFSDNQVFGLTIIAVLIAASIHKTSLFMLGIMPLLSMNVNKRNILIVIASWVFAFVFMEQIADIVRSFFPVYKYYQDLWEVESIITMIVQWCMFLSG